MSLTVVVGASRGIGRAIAEDLAHSDPKTPILLADIDGELVEKVAHTLRGEGIDATARTVDITDPSAVMGLISDSASADRVAIAAGIFRASPTIEVSVSELEQVLRVNTIGCFHVAQQYAAVMAEHGGGSIVAVASIAARMPRMRQAAYSASKAALRQALRVLSMEVAAQGVRVNTVSPGPTNTEMMQQLASDHSSVHHLADGELAAFRPKVPAGRVASTADIAAAVAFLLSPASQHIFMADLVVDGGELLGM